MERGRDILSGASKGNSAILHTGFDTNPETLEFECLQVGRAEYLRIMKDMNLPILETSAILLARDTAQLNKVTEIYDAARAKGFRDIKILDHNQLRNRFPWLTAAITGGLLVDGENVIDPWSTALAYAVHAIENGATVVRECTVQRGELVNGTWNLQTSSGEVNTKTIINAAGLYADQIETIRGQPAFEIRPRKGQFVVFDKAATATVNTIVLPIPTKETKGVLLAPTIFGNVICGPTSEDQDSREDSSVDQETLHSLVKFAKSTVPALGQYTITASYAGLRTATEHNDYQIHSYPHNQWITVGGIRSTGLTAALGIAKYVANLYSSDFESIHTSKTKVPISVANLAEHLPRPYQQGGHGEIVCHCEHVTRGEIESALVGVLPAKDISSLKRRTRCLMGRCQGFYCSWRIWQLTADKIYWPMDKSTGTPHERLLMSLS